MSAAAVSFAYCLHCRVVTAERGCKVGKKRLNVAAVKRDRVFNIQASFGQRACFVKAYSIDTRQHFNAVKVFYKDFSDRKPYDADSQCCACQQHEPLRDHTDERGSCTFDSLLQFAADLILIHEQQRADREDCDCDHSYYAFKTLHQYALRFAYCLC